MRIGIFITVSLVLASCSETTSAEKQTQGDDLLDAIEKTIELPDGAYRLDEYSRGYAKEGHLVHGVYLADKKTREAEAGTRRWYPDREALPQILDGGCLMVSVIYDASKRRFISISCNGVA